jgi:hypothetical protein
MASDVSVTIQDGGLGVVGSSSAPTCQVGTCSAGPLNTMTAFGTPEQVRAIHGSGPLVDALCLVLDRSGGPVYGVRTAATNNGTSSAVAYAQAGATAGPSPGATVTGNPLDAYEAIVEIIKGGAVATATFRVSLDGGDTWTSEYASAVSFATLAASTGLTLAFAAGTYQPGDRYTFTTTAPTFAAGDLATALDAIKAAPFVIDHIHIVGSVGGADDATKVTNHLALAAAVGVKMASFEAAYRYTYALLDAPAVNDTALQVPAVQQFANEREVWTIGLAEQPSSATNRVEKRHAGTLVSARIARAALDEDPASGITEGGDVGPVVKLFRDDRVTPGAEEMRMVGLRTYEGVPGVYTTPGKTMAASTSDFSDLPRRRVMDRACAVGRLAVLPLLHKALPVNKTTGRILERRARQIEAAVRARIEAVVGPFVSAVEVQVNRTDNILSSKELRITVSIIPKALGRKVSLTIGFLNPAIQVAA